MVQLSAMGFVEVFGGWLLPIHIGFGVKGYVAFHCFVVMV
jgi:hypothetical protein